MSERPDKVQAITAHYAGDRPFRDYPRMLNGPIFVECPLHRSSLVLARAWWEGPASLIRGEHLVIAVIRSGELGPYPLQRRRQHPVLEWPRHCAGRRACARARERSAMDRRSP